MLTRVAIARSLIGLGLAIAIPAVVITLRAILLTGGRQEDR